MAKAIGIDLGTTNTAAGLKRLQTEIIINAEGDPLTPSVVSYQKKRGLLKPGRFIVGKSALDWMSQDPQNTIVSVKRLMGRNFYGPEVQRLIEEQRYAYTVSPRASGSSHSVAVLLNGTEYTPEQISAKILGKVKSDCENRLGAPVQSAVVTVPAYFNDKQKHATRMAAALAGLKVQRLLPEPTAAAISFGVDTLSEGEAKTILVFDLGGGTFDISILTITDGQFIELGKGGDMWMGGDDIDAMISRYVYQQTEKDNEVEDLSVLIDQLTPTDKNRFVGDLKRNVEAAKIQLSKSDQALVEVLGLLKDRDGDIVDVEVELTRERFEDLLRPFVERAMTLTRKVVEGINFDLDLIDKVVMVGGSSSIPLVIQAMRELFGEDRVLLHERPMLAIAEGAAILAHRLADFYECPACGHEVTQSAETCPACGFDLVADLAKAGVVDIVHTTSHDYYLEMEDGSGHLLVEKNTPLPFKTQGTFKLVDPEQRLAHFRFYNTVNEIKEPIGDLWLAFDLPEDEAAKKAPRALLDFELDEDNIISVSAALKDRPEVRVSRTLSRGNTDERLFLELEQSIAQVNEAKHSYFVAYDFLHRAVGIARAIHRVIDPRTGEEDPEARREAVRRQQVANELVEKNESAIGNLYYAEHFVAQYGLFLKEAQRKSVEEKLQRLKDKSEQGSVAEILEARRKLGEELDKYPALMAIQDLEQAAEITAESDPAKAPRYDKYLQEVQNSIQKGDADTLARLMGEIMPEVHAILDAESGKDLHIWKGIQR